MKQVLFNIKQLRIVSGLAQAEVAEKLKISLKQYNNLENGKSAMSLPQLLKIAEVLRVDPSLFFCNDIIALLLAKNAQA